MSYICQITGMLLSCICHAYFTYLSSIWYVLIMYMPFACHTSCKYLVCFCHVCVMPVRYMSCIYQILSSIRYVSVFHLPCVCHLSVKFLLYVFFTTAIPFYRNMTFFFNFQTDISYGFNVFSITEIMFLYK